MIKRIALISTLALVLIGGGVTLASIDFRSRRVDRDRVSIETVQRGTMETKVSANGQLLPKNIEQIGAQVTGRVARAHVKPGDVVKEGQLLVELTNPEIIASADEAYSAWEGAVTELLGLRALGELRVLQALAEALDLHLDLRALLPEPRRLAGRDQALRGRGGRG